MTEYHMLSLAEFPALSWPLFCILAGNMSKIAPTGCSPEEDYAVWFPAVSQRLQRGECRIALALDAGMPIAYFQFCTADGLFMMEEMEIDPACQGSGVFRGLYGFVLPQAVGCTCVEAYANRANEKSIGILKKMGLQPIGTNKSSRSLHFRGTMADLQRWFSAR